MPNENQDTLIVPEVPAIEPGDIAKTSPTLPDPTKGDFLDGIDSAIAQDKAAAEGKKAQQEQPKPEDTAAKTEEPKEGLKIDLSKKQDGPADPQEEWKDTERVPHNREAWDKYKTKHNVTVKALKEKEARLAELEAKAAQLQELETLKQTVSQYEQQLKETAVVNDPTITKDIDSRLSAVSELAKAGLPDEQAAMIEQAMQMRPGKAKDKVLAEAMEDIPTYKQAAIMSHIANAELMLRERDSRLSEAKANADSILKQRQAKMEAERQRLQQTQSQAFDAAVSDLRKMDGWKELFSDEEGSKNWIEASRRIYNGGNMDYKALAMKAIQAEITPNILQHAISLTNRISELEGKLSEAESALKARSSTTPQIGIGSVPNTKTSADPLMDGLLEAYRM